MSRVRCRQRAWAWLLAVLLFGPAGSGLLARVHPAGATCATARHACCCGHTGAMKCACESGDPATRLAALTTCAGASELPAFLVALPAAIFPSAAVCPATPRRIGASRPRTPVLPASFAPAPTPPPPQA